MYLKKYKQIIFLNFIQIVKFWVVLSFERHQDRNFWLKSRAYKLFTLYAAHPSSHHPTHKHFPWLAIMSYLLLHFTLTDSVNGDIRPAKSQLIWWTWYSIYGTSNCINAVCDLSYGKGSLPLPIQEISPYRGIRGYLLCQWSMLKHVWNVSVCWL